jgi:uncharacterized GH25 family protein
VSNVAKIALPLLLLAVVGGGAYWYLQQSVVDVTPTPANVTEPATPPAKEPTPDVQPERVATPVVQAPERIAAPSLAGSEEQQGVRGRVLLPDGTPAVGTRALLLESAASNPIEMFLKNKMGRSSPPIAELAIGADGQFQLGVRQPGKAVDLRIVSEQHPEWSQQGIKVRDGDWFDLGEIRLEVGGVVSGRVLDQLTKAPIAEATVYLASASQSHLMVAVPGRERGIKVTTDPSGTFRFTNAPRQGIVNVDAEAPGYAAAKLLNQQLKADSATDLVLELEVGMPIAGVVVDPNGKPIPNASLAVTGLSAKTPQNAAAVSNGDGQFEFATLRPGPYTLTATSPQHGDVRLGMVMTGETEVKVVMQQRGIAKLKVLTARGQAVRSYRISLKRYFENTPLGIANVPEFPDRNINPGDYPVEFGGEFAAVRGLPAGPFRFQIVERDHAKSISPPFTIEEGGAPVEVVAQLTLGATITGQVVDEQGRAVADANVTSDYNAGLAADTPLFDLFQGMMPEKHSKASTRTDGQGRFRLSKLAFADYMVRVAHPAYCEGKAFNIKLENEGQVHDAGVITLSFGAELVGLVTVGGTPAGQIKVTISTPMTADTLPQAPPGGTMANATGQLAAAPTLPTKPLFNATVLSDGDGRFKLLKRVPPGTYRVSAARQGTGSPFDTLIDMKETERTITVAPGQDSVELNFALTRR